MSSKKQKVVGSGDVERCQKACLGVLRALQKMPDAGPFLLPVDWKTLKLPTYPKIVKNPMDLGTVEQKLQAKRYATVSDFAADVRLIWSNAQGFNLEGSDIYELAANLSNEFDSKMSQVPMGLLREGAARSTTGGGGGGSGEVLGGEALATCKVVVKDLRKHKDAAVFLEPVDWKKLGINDYPTIIKRPMDLGTILKRLESGAYTAVLDVISDIELVWSNAMTYNQDESYIYQTAAELKVCHCLVCQRPPTGLHYDSSVCPLPCARVGVFGAQDGAARGDGAPGGRYAFGADLRDEEATE